MSLNQRTLLSCAIGGILGISASSAAQESTRASFLEEVIVTAEKRAVSLQEVPVAVSAYTSETRDLLGVNTVEDLARFTPSVSYRNDDRLAIRGVGRLTNAVGTDPAVALYSDGIFSTSMADTSTPPLFIERTEILRGPQGTLYGRNSVGGTINVISKRPTEEFEGEVRASGANYGYYRTEGLLRGPFSDNFRYLIGGSLEKRDDGFIENRGPGEDGATSDRWMVEAQLEADLGENVVARVRYTKFEWDDTYGVGNTLLSSVSPYDTTSPYNSGLYYNSTFGFTGQNPAVSDAYVSDYNRTVVGTLNDHNRIHLDVTWDLGGATLKYLGGYQEYLYHTGSDSDDTPRTGLMNVPVPAGAPGVPTTMRVDFDGAGPVPVFTFARPSYTAVGVTTDREGFYEESQRWWSNEINVSSTGDGALQWIVGLYQYDTTWDNPQHTKAHGDAAILAPTGSPANPLGANGAINGHLEGESYAGFGQIDWTFADAWTLTLGARYTEDKKKGFDEAYYIGRMPATAIGAAESVFEGALRQQFATNPTLAPFSFLATADDATLRGALNNPAFAPLVQGVAAAILAQTQAIALDVTQSATGCVGCAPSPNGGLRRNLEGSWDGVTATAGIQWRPSDETNLYARYARGYKAGGFIASANMAPGVYADPEYLNSYELGWKQQLGGRVQLNSAVFFYDYEDFQAPLSVQLPGGTFFATQFLNLDAEVKGVEVETVWSPVDPLRMFLNASYLDSEITRGCCFEDTADPTATAPGARPVGSGGAQTLVGNSLPNAPELKYTFGTNYTWNFTAGALTAGGTYSYTDDLQSNVFSNPIHGAPSNEIADFRLLWNDGQDRYTIIAFVKNAFDEDGFIRSAGSSPTAVGSRRTVGLIYPRTYGLEAQLRF